MNPNKHPRYSEIVAHINSYVEVLRQMHETQEKLFDLPVEIDCTNIYEEILEYHEGRLRVTCGMPPEDELGHYVWDYYMDELYKLLEGVRSLNQVVTEFINWRNH